MRRIQRTRKTRKSDRGSALLVTLMVMVGLSLLGLAFVTISETESAISLNERNYVEAQAVAEAGARVALEWFQSPSWANTHGILPPNVVELKTRRNVTVNIAYGAFNNYYKEDGGFLFDKPFKGGSKHRFYGDESHADVIINSTTDLTGFLTTFNNALFPNSDSKISDIRVYAPPIIGATLNADGFYNETATAARYGVATIRVTAEKRVNGRLMATRWVKLVISEWPFPGPQGPVQSNANISTGGNFGVHWGKMTSERAMEIKRPWVGLPWLNAYDVIPYEWGYYSPLSNYEGALLNVANFETSQPWIQYVTDIGLEDPWFQARAKGDIANAIAGTDPHVFDYDDINDDITETSSPYTGWTNWFQNQSFDDPVGKDYKLVLFPKIDYEFWKNIAQSGSRSNNNVHYLSWAGGENYTDGIETKSFANWVNTAATANPAKPGFYFFDTREGVNPQGGAGGTLTTPIDITNADTVTNDRFMMKGFIYVNTETWSTQGLNGPSGYYNYPGEPYKDIGVTYSDGVFRGNNDGIFTFDDINNNKRVDIFVAPRTFLRPDGTSVTSYFPVKWFSGCVVGFNNVTTPGANCSEPHEPFLNLVYPASACCQGGGQPNLVTPKWEAGTTGNFTQRSKKKNDTTGLPIACAATSAIAPPDKECTSNGWDADGPLVQNFGGPNTEPVLDGVLYNEGNYASTGNATFFGSVLINGDISGSGTHEVWFDEFLVKGGWQDKFKELPRVYVTAHETDQ